MSARLTVLAGRVTAFIRSIRFRLALWFALVLALVLFVFSAFVYYRSVQDMRNQSAAYLVGRLRDMNAQFIRLSHERALEDWLGVPGIATTNPFSLYENEVMVVSDVEGNLAAFQGKIGKTDAAQAADQVPAVRYGKASGKLFLLKVHPGEAGGGRPIEYVFNAAPIFYEDGLLGWIILGRPVDPEDALPRLQLTLGLAGTFTLLVALAGGYLLADRALWPVKAITRTAREIGETDLSRRLNIHTRDELGELAGTFDSMLDRLQAAFNRQRQFTADASHELRTPLTIVGLETGRALSATRTLQEYQRSLRVIQSENEFMTRLVDELLTLARMDAGQANLKREPLDLSDVTLEVVERYARLAAEHGIRLQAGDLPELPIEGDRQYLAQMIGNLVDNAIKYSLPGNGSAGKPAGGETSGAHWVRVETGAAADGRRLAWVRVADNGPGIEPDHLPHLFDRFYRVDRARSHNLAEDGGEEAIPGSGLGLSIVQWIARLHGGEVTARSEPGQGAVFEVYIPLAK